MKRHVVYRSAITGRYVTKGYAQANPDTTMRLTVGPLVAAVARLTRLNRD